MLNSRGLRSRLSAVLALSGLALVSASLLADRANSAEKSGFDAVAETVKKIRAMKVGSGDWPMWGGSVDRNNTPEAVNVATEWDVAEGTNIKWSMPLGSETYGNPVIANGKVYIGTNNGAGYLKRYPAKIDLGCLICFEESTGKFLWQASSEKLPTGRVHDWPNQGICCSPLIDGDLLWYVSSRGEVVCLDVEGFHDGENDGPFKTEVNENKDEGDVIWKLDMMAKLSVSQHNMANCSLMAVGDLLFVNTSNGVDEGHVNLPQPTAPSFICVDKNKGEVVWTDNTPGRNVLHGQWSSPAYGVFEGQPQVLFAGGDGWLYSFDPAGNGKGGAKLLWKFDCNPKESVYVLGGRATRNHLIATPVVYDGMVYIAVGEDPEHGEGVGHLWCINPVNKGGDVSPTQVFNAKDPKTPVAHKRLKALEADKGDLERENANSAAVWHYIGKNPKKFEESMHRTCGTVTIKDDFLVIGDFSGLLHCLNAKTGEPYWTHDQLADSWGSALIVEDKIYTADGDGDVTILKLGEEKEVIAEINMESAIYTSPVVGNNVLYVANRNTLFAIQPGTKSKPNKGTASSGSDSD
jgi:outer membrane protein assembly factor BamB